MSLIPIQLTFTMDNAKAPLTLEKPSVHIETFSMILKVTTCTKNGQAEF